MDLNSNMLQPKAKFVKKEKSKGILFEIEENQENRGICDNE